MPRKRNTPLGRTRAAFDRQALQRICEMPEGAFAAAFDLDTYTVDQAAPDNFYCHRDNGSDILAVAHLDTVAKPGNRKASFVETAAGTVVHSRALDDRLGAYVILDMLPKLGITCDILLTVGEESGQSTAQFFDTDKQYDWLIEFDRGGTDVVMYQYEDAATANLVKDAGARVGEGSFSDISYLDHLGCKGFNWGVGYRDYHSARAHAYLEDTFAMVTQFLTFHGTNAGTYLAHKPDTHLDDTYLDAEVDPFRDEFGGLAYVWDRDLLTTTTHWNVWAN